MNYDFDAVIRRTNSAKWLEMDRRFGSNDLLPFWFADMDFISPQPVIDALTERAKEGIYGYAYRPESYFEAIQGWFLIRHGWQIDREAMLYSPGVIAAISILIRELTRPGDKIVIQTPVYPPFYDVVRNNGRTLLCNPLVQQGGRYAMDYDGLGRLLAEGAKMLILCSPHNPVGRVWERGELERLGELCLRHGVTIVSDEVHADIVYKPHVHIPIASLSPELKRNCITCIAPNKTFNLAGLQGATAVIDGENERRLFDAALGTLDVKRNNVFSLVATEAAYRYGGEWYEQMLAYLTGNLELVKAYFAAEPRGVKLAAVEGTYLLWLDLRALGLTDSQIREKIIRRGRIALDFGGRYGSEGFLRLSIGCTRALLREGLARLDAALGDL